MSRASRPRSATAASRAVSARDSRSSSTSASARSRSARSRRISRITMNHGTTENSSPLMWAPGSSRTTAATTTTPASVRPADHEAGAEWQPRRGDHHDDVDAGVAAAVGLDGPEHDARGADQREPGDARASDISCHGSGTIEMPTTSAISDSVTSSPSPESPGPGSVGDDRERIDREERRDAERADRGCPSEVRHAAKRYGAFRALSSAPGWIRLHPRVETQVRPVRR